MRYEYNLVLNEATTYISDHMMYSTFYVDILVILYGETVL